MRLLKQLTGRGAGRRLSLDGLEPGAELRIGRDVSADFVIDEDHVSGTHLILELLETGVLARDMKSTNGSVVVRGGKQIVLDPARDFKIDLRHGDVLHIGDPARPIHMSYQDAAVEESSTKQEILAVASLTGVREFEVRLRKDPDKISVLYEITKELTGERDPGVVGRCACEGVFKLLKVATHMVIMLQESAGGEFIHFIGLDREGSPVGHGAASRSIIEEVRENAAGVLVADTGSEPSPAASLLRLGIRTIIAVPLWVGDRVTGVLQADNRGGGGVFTESDLELLTVLAGQVSLAIENARLISHLQAAEVRLEEENQFLKQEDERSSEIIGTSQGIKQIFSLIEKVQNTRVPVCIEGETGTGKELVARALHYRSNRKKKLFVTQNCAAIPESILESELFGHVRGSFTGADRDKKGLFEIADGGSVFLDEIGETTPGMQAKLLRVLQEGEVRPVGSSRTKKVDVRIVSATNRNLEEEVEAGRFREDLYYRLKVFPIVIPPLRDRREDIPLLARHFLERYCQEANRNVPTFGPEALALMMAYRWPGNIRELQNEIQRVVIAGTGEDFVLPVHLSERLRKPGDLLEQVNPKRGGLKEMLDEVEKWIILDTLRDHNNNKTQTAEALKISREGLHKKLTRFGLK